MEYIVSGSVWADMAHADIFGTHNPLLCEYLDLSETWSYSSRLYRLIRCHVRNLIVLDQWTEYFFSFFFLNNEKLYTLNRISAGSSEVNGKRWLLVNGKIQVK